MKLNELRKKYLDYFEKNGHSIVPSSSLLPENDSTTLFTGSGMQPMLPYLLGQKHPLGTRIADSQKCFRAEDVEEVGDNRHTTFFEMLGNWSLGDYFKEEQIDYIFNFLINELDLDPNRIYISVFRGNEELNIPKDEEAVKFWQDKFSSLSVDNKVIDKSWEEGLGDGRIFYYDDKKNWWSRSGVPSNMPDGEPGGPDSEIFWDFGEELGLHEKSEFKNDPCHINCDCGRFMEIGNSVFMTYMKKDGKFIPLEQKNIDFGGGLERMVAATRGDPDMFNIDVFSDLKEVIEKASGKKYEDNKISFRIIMDHIRASVFLISDGIVPSNKDAGYFVRRLLRRAILHADKLGGINEGICSVVADRVIQYYESTYYFNNNIISDEINREEKAFWKVVSNGRKLLEKMEGDISGLDAFNLYQTYGFPIELTEEFASGDVDVESFKEELKKHQELSRTASSGMFKAGLADNSEMVVKYHTATHLLHTALREVLGGDVGQMGSNITGERLRFDFSFDRKMTPDEVKQVEDWVNDKIEKGVDVIKEEMDKDEALLSGALSFFREKYPDRVTVYSIGDVSKEICSGPHVKNTKELGHFKIKKEESSSRGIRRIKAILS